jgi:hypothetical protein
MDIRTYQLCLAAQEFMRMHGRFYAATFLAENNVRIEIATVVLTSSSSVLALRQCGLAGICPIVGHGDI